MGVVFRARRIAQSLGQHLAVHAKAGERCTQFVRGGRRKLRALTGDLLRLPHQHHHTQPRNTGRPHARQKRLQKSGFRVMHPQVGGIEFLRRADDDVPTGALETRGDRVCSRARDGQEAGG